MTGILTPNNPMPDDQPDSDSPKEPSLDWFAEKTKRKPRPKKKGAKKRAKRKPVSRRGRPRKSKEPKVTPRTIGPIPWDNVPARATVKEDAEWVYSNLYRARIFHEDGSITPDFDACDSRPPSMGALIQLESAVRDSDAWIAKVYTPLTKNVIDVQELKRRDKLQRVDIEEILEQFEDAGERR